MHGWGFSGILLILLILLIIVVVLVRLSNYIVHNAINNSEFKRSVDRDLKKMKEDINDIIEQLKSKDK